MATEAYALAHTVYWTSSRGYFSATGRPVEKSSTGRPVEWFYWTSSKTDDLGQYVLRWTSDLVYFILITYNYKYQDILRSLYFSKNIYFFLAIGEGFEQKMAEKKKNL